MVPGNNGLNALHAKAVTGFIGNGDTIGHGDSPGIWIRDTEQQFISLDTAGKCDFLFGGYTVYSTYGILQSVG